MIDVNWNYPSAIRFGAGRVSELTDCCRNLDINAPLLITDPGLAKMPMIVQSVTHCRDSGLNIDVFSDIKPNPIGENIAVGIACFQDGRHDGIIAFGGGSALDAGKAIAVLAKQSCDIWDLEDIDDNWRKADSNKIAPVIAVPTTAGTGSEVGRAAVIANNNEQRKVILFHPEMMPRSVLLDPELTLGLPAGLTAATGMDALAHNLEAYCSPIYHPLATGIAIEGIRLIRDNLPGAVSDGSSIEHRSQMLVASMMGATAFQRGLGAMHALAHPLGALFDAHHGMLNAILMPYVLQVNRVAIEENIDNLSHYLNLKSGFDSFLQWVLELREQIDIPNTLADIGIDDSCMDTIGKQAAEDPSAATNPVKFGDEDYQMIFQAALQGKL